MKNFINNLRETLEIEDHNIKPEDKFRDYDEWDSLAFLSLQAMINNEYNITIPRSDFDKVQTIAELYKLIQEKLL